MSRDGGFSIGDRSTRTLYDVRLVRATRRAGLGAIVAWDAVVDASWQAGERVPFDDAVDTLPYDLGDTAAIRAALVAVCLLDDDGLIRGESWASWFGVADERREAKRERDRAYAAARRQRVGNESQAVVPTDRSDRTDRPVRPPRAGAREATANAGTNGRGGPVPIAELVTPEALAAAGRKP